MTPAPERLVTDRLVLRRWRESDREPFAVMNRDPEVVRWLSGPMTREKSDAFVDRCTASFAEDALGSWALERRDTGEFIGFTGVLWQRFEAPFTPAAEVGWRLAHAHWGHGFAPEAATAALDDVFGRAVVDEIVSMTAVGNAKSRRVMEKLGLTRDPADDFDHTLLAEDHPLRRHVLYRLRRDDWLATR